MGYIYKAGVVGAGLMGSGIAQVISYAGLPVVLKDVSQALVDKGLKSIRDIYDGRVRKGKMSAEQLEQKMALVTGATDDAAFGDVDIVIEAVPEDLDLKKRVFADLARVTSSSCILATNTSALSITEMGAASGRPDKVIGLHFFYPAPVMKLVEVIPTAETSQDTLDTSIALVESLRKLPVRVKECAGFLVNRLLMPYIGEAAWALQDGAATAKEIDEAMTAFGMPMGPFLLADTLGIDVCYKVAQILEAAYGERARPPAILGELYERKRFGAKSGAGFYVYGDAPDILPQLVKGPRTEPATPKPQGGGGGFSAERILYPMVNEAAFCLDEDVASAGDIDLAMLAGAGFPQQRGGLLKYADSVGLDRVLQFLQKAEKSMGSRFRPSDLLVRKVREGALGASAKRGFFEYT
jgi:3-hydroxyacyl-CoA dehydrogenase